MPDNQVRTEQAGRGALECTDLEFLPVVQSVWFGIQQLKKGTINFVGLGFAR